MYPKFMEHLFRPFPHSVAPLSKMFGNLDTKLYVIRLLGTYCVKGFPCKGHILPWNGFAKVTHMPVSPANTSANKLQFKLMNIQSNDSIIFLCFMGKGG